MYENNIDCSSLKNIIVNIKSKHTIVCTNNKVRCFQYTLKSKKTRKFYKKIKKYKERKK